jgi:hypothetical protein
MTALMLSGGRPKTTGPRVQLPLANRHWISVRVGVASQVRLVLHRSAPPPAHPFPIRI